MNYTKLSSHSMIVLPLICTILIGCGSGAPSTQENDSGENEKTSQPAAFLGIETPEEFGPFSDYANKAITSYNGRKSEESLTLESSQTLLTNALFGIERDNVDLSDTSYTDTPWIGLTLDSLFQFPLVEINSRSNQLPLVGQRDCHYEGKNGTMSVEMAISDIDAKNELKIYKIVYNDCAYVREGNYTGTLYVMYVRTSNGTNLNQSNTYIAYDNITVSSSKGQYEITGASKWLNPRTCGVEGRKTYFVNIKNLSTGETVLYENYSTALVADYNSECESDGFKPNYFQGRIFNSNLGVTKVTTQSALRYPIDRPIAGQREIVKDPGMVLLESGVDTLEFSISRIEGGRNTSYTDIYQTASIRIDNQTSGFVKEFDQPLVFFWQGGFSKLNDSDADGMNDSWELLHGLNPNNSADSQSDEDGDSVPAIMEHRYFGNPNAKESSGLVLDRTIGMELYNSFAHKQHGIQVEVNNAQQVRMLAEDSNYTVTIAPSVVGQWYLNGYDCELNSEFNSLECPFSKNFYATKLFFVPEENGLVEFSALTDVPENDIRPENNRATNSIEFERPKALQAPQAPIIRTNYKLLTDDIIKVETNQEQSIKSTIARTIGSDTSPLQITISHPAEVSITSTSPNENTSTESCEIKEEELSVECTSRVTFSTPSPSLTLTFNVSEPGEYDINWLLEPVEHETVLSDNEATTKLVVQHGVGELQTLIDNASPGDIVTLPPGEFVGELSLRKKHLVLQGAQGEAPTVLRTENRFDFGISEVGDKSIIRNIHFKVYGSAISFENGDFLTVANNVFEPDNASVGEGTGSLGTSTGMLVDSGLYGDRRNASFRFINNTVHSFGIEGKLTCSSLMNVIGWREVYIEHNVFTNNNCNGPFLSGENAISSDYDESIYISNNTFADVKRLYSATLYPANTPTKNHTTYFVNNILVNVDSIFTDSMLDQYTKNNAHIYTENNLLFESERDKIITDQLIIDGNGVQLSPDINGDPQFDDEANGVYTLKVDSPAIDTGVIPTAGDMGVVYDGEPLYLDGDLDGVITPDIGAHEFNPQP